MRIFVKPGTGLVVLDPEGRPIPAEGLEVAKTSFWIRRIASGDVVESVNRDEEEEV